MAGNSPTIPTDELNRIPAAHKYAGRVKFSLKALLMALDALSLSLAFVIGYQLREVLPLLPQPEFQPPLLEYLPTLVLHIVLTIVIAYFSQLYHQPRVFSRFDQARNVIGVVTLGALLAYSMQELIFRNSGLYVNYPRSMFFYVWLMSVSVILVGREIHRFIQTRIRMGELAKDNLLIVGTGDIAREIIKRINDSPELGYRIVGVVNSPTDHQGRMLGIPIVGNYQTLPDVLDRYQVEQVIIALPDAKRNDLVELVAACQRGSVDVKIYPDILASIAGNLNVHDIAGMPLLTVRDVALRGWKLSLKRALDVFGAVFGLIFLSPLMLLTGIIVWLSDRGPVFYTQERIGMDGRPFPMIKFRSMRVDAEAAGPGWTVENDPRVTRIGRFMRRTSWDEIPQLINVLFGHMSLVGPRPERGVYVEEFRKQIPRYMERHREMVGMTGWAQVHGLRGDTSIAQRTAYDLWYVENWSLWLDIQIIIRTIIQTLLRRDQNAY